jgi:hypothetical protein
MRRHCGDEARFCSLQANRARCAISVPGKTQKKSFGNPAKRSATRISKKQNRLKQLPLRATHVAAQARRAAPEPNFQMPC